MAKFKDLEIRQDKLIREMDDAISVYLIEMREENDRLIKELSNVKHTDFNNNGAFDKQNVAKIQEELTFTSIQNDSKPEDIAIESKPFVPKNVVKNAYNQYRNLNIPPNTDNEVKEKEPEDTTEVLTFEQQVLKLHKEGKSIDEIAKITQKGKTEIELFIKFHA